MQIVITLCEEQHWIWSKMSAYMCGKGMPHILYLHSSHLLNSYLQNQHLPYGGHQHRHMMVT